MAKRLFDIVFSAMGLVITSPFFLLIAIWIKLEGDGPVFFRQQRVGLGGKSFALVKFRTMVPEAPGEGDIGVTMSGHPRVRRASGKFLRKTKLDELPQLMNVLRGDMSFVGPRPELEKYVEHYPEEDKRTVLSVRPGITDWAAIKFADEEAMMAGRQDPEQFYINSIMPEKVALYRQYVENRSFFYDVGLICLTVTTLLIPGLRKRFRYTGH